MTEDATFMELEQAMERLALPRAEIYRRVKEGGLTAQKVEQRLRFDPDEVERYAGVLQHGREALHGELDRWLQHFAARTAAPTGAVDGPGTDAAAPPESEADKVAALGELLLRHAAQADASDLYLDPVSDGSRLLLGLPGSVLEAARFGAAVSGPLREWFKAMGPPPPEGASREALVQRDVDGESRQYRLAVIPTALGELVHLHDFAMSARDDLESLGYTEAQARSLRATVGGHPGLFVVAGPPDTWGERHRLAMARELSAAGRLVVSIEHRVHYRSELLVQLECGTEEGSFPALWRRALDMRPDYIFLDEVRDEAEAGCLLEGVQAGAVVVSQVAASDALAALRRLVALEVEGGALSRALLACSERVVLRRLCPACRLEVRADESMAAAMGLTSGERVWQRGEGCDRCTSGWMGHVALFGLRRADGPLLEWLDAGGEATGPEPAADDLSLVASLRAAAQSGAIDVSAALAHFRPRPAAG